MRKILHWELKTTLLSKKFFLMLGAITAMTFMMLAMGLYEKAPGYQLFIGVISSMPGFITLGAAIFAGLSISAGYSERLAQAAVIAGVGRVKFALNKSISFFIAIASFLIIPALIIGAIIALTVGIALPDGTDGPARDILFPFATILIVLLGSTSAYIPLSFLIKSVGPSIGVNVGAYLAMNMAPMILGEINSNIPKWIPWGQLNIILEDPTPTNCVRGFTVCAAALILFVALSIKKFSKAELK